jgi:hypothetical protein
MGKQIDSQIDGQVYTQRNGRMDIQTRQKDYHIGRQIDRHIDGLIDGKADIQMNGQTERQTDRQTQWTSFKRPNQVAYLENQLFRG